MANKPKKLSRTRLRNNLSRMRNRLSEQGANDADLKEIFQTPVYQHFGEQSTEELQQIYDRIKSYGSLKVMKENNNHVVTSKYYNNYKAFSKTTENEIRPARNFKSSLESDLLKYKNAQDVYKKRNKEWQARKEMYIEYFKSIGIDEKDIKKMQRMGVEKFRRLIKNGGGFLEMRTIFGSTPKGDDEDDYLLDNYTTHQDQATTKSMLEKTLERFK